MKSSQSSQLYSQTQNSCQPTPALNTGGGLESKNYRETVEDNEMSFSAGEEEDEERKEEEEKLNFYHDSKRSSQQRDSTFLEEEQSSLNEIRSF